MRDVFIAGAAATAFGKFVTRSLRSLAEEAVAEALEDAGAGPSDVDAVFFANAAAGVITGQEMIRGQSSLRHTGLLGGPLVNVENACASGSSAFHLAWLSVASGAADVALAVGAEKLTHPDKMRTFAAFNGGVDLDEFEPPKEDGGPPKSLFMDVYAGLARDYMQQTDATSRDLAQVAVKSHENGAKNPKAQYRKPVTVDQVLASRAISDPLTLLMCSPIGDGAAALLLASEDQLLRLSGDPVRVLATTMISGQEGAARADSVVRRAAQRAYEQAAISPDDVDLVELHDAAAIAELIVPEELGMVPEGGGLELLRSGASAIGGRLPLNPSGGLLAKGHPVGATGCAQIVEIVEQLRGRCGERSVPRAGIGLAENAGGWLGDGPAVATVTILKGVGR
jgi:acetyl-CoA acyltransferase